MLILSLILFLIVIIGVKVGDDWIRQKHIRKTVIVWMFFTAIITMIVGIVQYIFN